MSRVFSNIDFVTKQIQEGFVLWEIKSYDGKQKICYNDEPLPGATAAKDFKESCDNLQGIVSVTLSHPDEHKTNSYAKMNFNLDLGGTSDNQNQNSRSRNDLGGFNDNSMFAMLMQQMNKTHELQNQLTELRLRSEFEKKEDRSEAQKLMMQSRLVDNIEYLIHGSKPAKKIAGTGDEKGNPDDQAKERKARAVLALQNLKDVPDLDRKLEKLAEIKKNNPVLFDQLMKGLDTM